MPVDKQVYIQYQVLNKCFRDPYKEYAIDDLVDACNAALHKEDRQEVSKRTIQNDIAQLQFAPNYTVISINVKIKKELESQLLSFGDDIEVLAPEDFHTRIAGKICSMYQKYQNDDENLHT